MDFTALLALPVVKKVIDVIRYLFDGHQIQLKEILTVLASWVFGTGIAFAVAASGFAGSVGLLDAGVFDKIIAGIIIGSAAGIAADATDGGITIL